MIDPAYILQRLGPEGATVTELANELSITPRHVRRLAKAAGWTPSPRVYQGPRRLVLSVSPEVMRALEARAAKHGGHNAADVAEALLGLVADADAIEDVRAASGRLSSWPETVGFLDAWIGRVAGLE